MNQYYSLEDLMNMINEPNRSCCIRLWSDNRELFEKAQGSIVKHQAWRGGYLQHLEECGNIAIQQYDWMSQTKRELPFSLSDALLVLCVHDLEKPFKQAGLIVGAVDASGMKNREVLERFKLEKLNEYNIVLTRHQSIALQHIEGELDYSLTEKLMNPLGAFCHSCDVLSARMWYDRPLREKENWSKEIKTV